MVVERFPEIIDLPIKQKEQQAEELLRIVAMEAEKDPALLALFRQRLEEHRAEPDSGTRWEELRDRMLDGRTDTTTFQNQSAAAYAMLPGIWQMRRTIAGQAAFTGVAKIQRMADRLSYREEGTMNLNSGRSFSSTRMFSFKEEEELLLVYFDDGPNRGQLFLRLEFSPATDSTWPMLAKGEHPCGCDLHRASYEFVSRDQFTIAFHVAGPDLEYVSNTEFVRT